MFLLPSCVNTHGQLLAASLARKLLPNLKLNGFIYPCLNWTKNENLQSKYRAIWRILSPWLQVITFSNSTGKHLHMKCTADHKKTTLLGWWWHSEQLCLHNSFWQPKLWQGSQSRNWGLLFACCFWTFLPCTAHCLSPFCPFGASLPHASGVGKWGQPASAQNCSWFQKWVSFFPKTSVQGVVELCVGQFFYRTNGS